MRGWWRRRFSSWLQPRERPSHEVALEAADTADDLRDYFEGDAEVYKSLER